MANGEVRVSDGEKAESLEDLTDEFPEFLPRSDVDPNLKLLNSIAHEFDSLSGDILDVDNASTIQYADSIAQLENLAKLMDLSSKEGESKEKYRNRTIAEFQKLTSEGTAKDVLNNSSTILGIENDKIGYNKLNENGAIQLKCPGKALDNLAMTDSEFQEIITKHAAAGYRLDVTRRGTFTYVSASDYNDGNMESQYGYNGLDSNGNPKNNGGTYAGLI